MFLKRIADHDAPDGAVIRRRGLMPERAKENLTVQRILTITFLSLLAAACSAEPTEESREPAPGATAQTPAVPAQRKDDAPGPATGRTSQYSKLDSCKVIEMNADEAYSISECPGAGGYRLRVNESDLRETAAIVAPDGARQDVNFSPAARSGGFSSIGDTIEWRGLRIGNTVDTVILRYALVEDPENPEKPTRYLLTIALDGKAPCITSIEAPGAGQNEKARVAADARPRTCLPAPN